MDTSAESTVALTRGLAGYVRAVARELGLPAESTSFEISDTVTAYLGLAATWAPQPGRDLMLTWNEGDGWSIAVETRPSEDALVIAHFGSDLVPAPAAVSRFVAGTLTGHRPEPRHAAPSRRRPDRGALAGRLRQYSVDT